MIRKLYTFIVILFFKNFPGSIGIKLRYVFYKPLFYSCGTNIKIGCGVIIHNFDQIILGSNIRIDDYTIINVGDIKNNRIVYFKKPNLKNESKIKLNIKDFVHINQFCMISSFNYLEINKYCTFSSGVKVYSVSHHYRDIKSKETITYSNNLDKSIDNRTCLFATSIILQENVFVSINTIILGGTIGKNSFIYPNSVIFNDIKENSIFKNGKTIGNRFQ